MAPTILGNTLLLADASIEETTDKKPTLHTSVTSRELKAKTSNSTKKVDKLHKTSNEKVLNNRFEY